MTSRSVARTLFAALLAAVVAAAVALPSSQAATGQIVTNKWFPLKPGTTFHYKSDQGKTVTVAVLHNTRVIQGHTSQRVETKEYEGGQLTEHFNDWYWQNDAGRVYYLKHTSARPGENWEAGKDGARRGTYILASPAVGDVWHRTNAPNAGREGRDRAEAYYVSSQTVKLRVGSYANLYPETVRFYYTAGKGLTKIRDKDETTTLTSVTHG